MAGIGRRTLYRKSVMDSYLNELPELERGQIIAEVKASRGSNLMEIQCSTGEESLAMLPTKFRKLIWVKRGDFVIVSGSSGDVTTATGQEGKVKYSIVHILSQDHIRELRKSGQWPEIFSESSLIEVGHQPEDGSESKEPKDTRAMANEIEEGSTDDDAQDDLYAFMKMDSNPNHQVHQHYYDDSESEESEEEDDES